MIKKNGKEVGFIYRTMLPSAYQEVQYIGGSGTQYIDTDFIPAKGDEFDIEYAYTVSNHILMTLCSAGAGSYQTILLGYSDEGFFFYKYFATGGATILRYTNPVLNEFQKLNIKSDGKVYINDSYVGQSSPVSELDGNKQTLYIMARRGDRSSPFYGNIKRFTIKRNNNAVLDLIPCYRKSDNVIGMYDLVEKKFYTNDGEGTFTKGNDVGTANIDKIYHGEDLVFEQGFTREQTGVPPITTNYQAIGKDLKDYKIYGQSIQNGTPTPSVPIAIESVGDKTANLLKTYGRIQGYPSNTESSASTQRKYDYNTYVLGLTYKNIYVPTAVNSYSITKDKITINVNSVSYGIGFPMQVIPGETYVFSYANGGNSYRRMLFYDAQGNFTRSTNLSNNTSYTINNDEVCAVFILNATTAGTDAWIEKPQWELGTTKTDFDYYGYKIPVIATNGTETFTTNIYLDEPLRKVGDYADYIDFKNSKVVRNLGYRVFTRTTTNTAYDSTLSATLEFNLSNSVHLSPLLSNRAVTGNIVADSNIGQARIYQGNFQIRVKYPDGITNANTKAEKRAAYNQWLSNNNIDLIYRLNTPTEETIELPDIPTIKGTTIYSVGTTTQPSSMYIKYKSK